MSSIKTFSYKNHNQHMKAVILAAGLGTRLRPITDSVPKCMVPVNGQCIIDKQIDNLKHNNLKESDIYVIGGYKEEVLLEHLKENYPGINFISNPRYNETNNMYSLYLAAPYVKDKEFLLMNADVFYDSNIIAGLLQGNCSLIACDQSCYMEESMKITLSENGNINHISKKITEVDHYAVSIDVYRISQESSSTLFKEIEDTIVSRKDENSWTELALDAIFSKSEFSPYVIEGRWFEIDTLEDLKKAESIFCK